ncbi:hypothetical protein MED121_16609 [Marinomonas sp. MED121]|uniref:hypothetical protein n=1 Tax=Marinomonas sp. MED121 TaxID=314277 RepID=UPI0000690F8C|nr:hypothetical protein [Marinomonas sp. MED121]EAQ67567.1 hypothetical protein MED121_16609 [Marinomonas sp. MED121]
MKKTLFRLGVIVAICVIAYFVVITSYLINFGSAWSSEQGDWGTFGDFVGGTLNPLMSFMALIALLYTIVLQSKELELTRVELTRSANESVKQSKYFASQQQRDDTYRLISKLSDRINNTYNNNNLSGNKSIHAALIGQLDVHENDAFYHLVDDMDDPLSQGYSIVKYLESDLIYLSDLINEYEKISKEISSEKTPLKLFYKKEYEHLVTKFCELKWFDRKLSDFYVS